MKDYGLVIGEIEPVEIDIRPDNVFVASNIQEVTTTDTETGEQRTEYQYNLVEYEKDEYITTKFNRIIERKILSLKETLMFKKYLK